jgi:aminopeptidase C
MAELTKWLSEQQGTGQGIIDWADMANLSDIFKKTEYVCYIIKDSNLLKRMVVNMLMDYTAAQAGVTTGEFDKMTMNISMDMNIYDHNMPFSITLPVEAENAMEVSGDTFAN